MTHTCEWRSATWPELTDTETALTWEEACECGAVRRVYRGFRDPLVATLAVWYDDPEWYHQA